MSLAYDSLTQLFDRYDAFLIDQFGVLMSGDGPYPGATEALGDLAARGKPVVVLSNSGKRSAVNNERLVQNGFDRSHFETVLTSGEIAHSYLRGALGKEIPHQAQALVILRDDDTSPFDDLPLRRTDNLEAADVLLIVNRDPSREIAFYKPILRRLAARKIPCICTNPDLKMLTPDGTMESAGYLAQMFEDLGGEVRWFGKPHAKIYEYARTMLKGASPSTMLCIGDSLHHDVAGGASAGFKTALVRTGIDEDLDDAELQSLVATSRILPDHFLRSFSLK